MSENLENRISSEQAKDTIFKMHSIQSSASEIDASANGMFKNVKIDTDRENREYALDIHHFSGQGMTNDDIGIVLHNYTDSKCMQLDNVGSGTILVLKNAYNPTHRTDKDANFVGTGLFLHLIDSSIVNGTEVNSNVLRVFNNGEFVFQKPNTPFKLTNNNPNVPTVDSFKFSTNNATRIVNFDEKFRLWDEGSTLSIKLSKDTIFQLNGVNIARLFNNKLYLYENLHIAKGIVDKNGSMGTFGQVLTSNGDGTCEWK